MPSMTFTKDELGVMIQILDAYIKSGGVAVVKNANYFVDKFSAYEKELLAPATPKPASTSNIETIEVEEVNPPVSPKAN